MRRPLSAFPRGSMAVASGEEEGDGDKGGQGV